MRGVFFCVAVCVAASLFSLKAAEGAALSVAGGKWFQTVNESQDCLVESADPILNAEVLRLVAPLAATLLPLPPVPKKDVALAVAPQSPASPALFSSRLLLRLEPALPAGLGSSSGVASRTPFLTVVRNGSRFDFQVTDRFGPDFSPEEWLRQIVTAMLYRRAVAQGAGPRFAVAGSLPPVPLWLVEGTFQTMLSGHSEIYRGRGQAEVFGEIAHRARVAGTTPSVAVVAAWQDLSEDPVFRPWQQAFCWRLALFYKADPGRSERLDRWYAEGGEGLPHAEGQADPVLEERWRAFDRVEGGDALYSWGQTAAALAAMQTLSLSGDPKDKKCPPVTVKWSELVARKNYPDFLRAVSAKRDEMFLLEMKAHFAWRPVIALYREALASLIYASVEVKGRPEAKVRNKAESGLQGLGSMGIDSFPARLAAADGAAQRLAGLEDRLDDYLNWFEVTRRTGSAGDTVFRDYFELRNQFEALARRGQDAAAPTPAN